MLPRVGKMKIVVL